MRHFRCFTRKCRSVTESMPPERMMTPLAPVGGKSGLSVKAVRMASIDCIRARESYPSCRVPEHALQANTERYSLFFAHFRDRGASLQHFFRSGPENHKKATVTRKFLALNLSQSLFTMLLRSHNVLVYRFGIIPKTHGVGIVSRHRRLRRAVIAIYALVQLRMRSNRTVGFYFMLEYAICNALLEIIIFVPGCAISNFAISSTMRSFASSL